MRINGHAHIFNLQSVLTDEAIVIMANRLRRLGIPEFVVAAVEGVLQDQLERPEYLNERELLARFVQAMIGSRAFRSAPNLPVDIRFLGDGAGGAGGGVTALGVRALEAVLDRISAAVGSGSGPGQSPRDVFQTLRIAMSPDIPRVAGKLLAHLGPDDAIVALMMDITTEKEGARDRLNFRRQIEGTQEAVLAFPGRVLPFIAVDPRRQNHQAVMRQAIEEDGFVGVKLYPSLGYELDAQAIRDILDYCRLMDVPITIHTSATGFNRDDVTAQFCHPRHWQRLFQPNDPLRVCFAHCGGWGGLCGQVEDQAEWAEAIFRFMDDYPSVHADISYHVDQMRSPEAERAYVDALIALIDGERGDRIVFGTDSWLLRLSMDDALYWNYFERKLGTDRFDKIARDVPATFLGLPVGGRPALPNIQRHLEFLAAHADRLGAIPARWVRDASGARWSVVRRDTLWSANNWAHRITFSYLRDQLPRGGRNADFVDTGPVRLRQLSYFRRSRRGPSKRVVEGKALELMRMCRDYATPESDHTDQTILDALIRVLSDPDRTVAEVGATVDALYLFHAEVA
jgi:predicted TIM-barrel fold metal-dependent hydrolase